MVTKFKTKLECALYIRKQVNMFFPLWQEVLFEYEGLPNGIMEVDYRCDNIIIQFQQDRGCLDFSVYKNHKQPSNLSWEKDVHQGIIKTIPDIDPEWYCTPCYELVDFYINFLKERFDTFVWDEESLFGFPHQSQKIANGPTLQNTINQRNQCYLCEQNVRTER